MQQPSPKYIEEAIQDADAVLSQPEFDFESECFSLEKPFAMPDAIISVDGEIVSTAGNVTTIAGQAKSGKSAIVSAFLAGAIAAKGSLVDTLGFKILYNSLFWAVLHFDTEQSNYNHFKSFCGAYHRAGRNKDIDFLRSFNIRKYEFEARRKYIEQCCTLYSERHGGIFLIVIDGIADLLKSPNDEEESNNLISWVEKLAIAHNCPVIVILHFNPNSEKERGHLGSQLQRKSESVLSVMKIADSQESKIQGKFLRNAGDIPEITFKYDKEKGYHVITSKANQEDKRIQKDQQKQKELAQKESAIKEDFESVLGTAWMKNKDLIVGYMELTGLKRDAANKHLALVKHQFQQNINGEYGRL